ncbi:MAG: cupin domain-containing protein [Alphaproteobacteria bacterium]|nr:MAG: cupin domain-containing protein [Alphaproteobacteria bacterium]
MTNSYEVGASDERPWGRWTVLDVGDGFAVKRIEVHGGHRLSLQRHRHRAEDWILVQGEAVVRVGEEEMHLKAPARVHIPVGSLHQIANPGTTTLVFIEVQTGPVLDEADIERISDDYGRA